MKYFFLLTLPFFFFFCNTQKVKPKINASINVAELPSQESWNSTITFTDSGRIQAVMKVGHLRMFSKQQETLIDGYQHVDFYNPSEIKTTTLTSLRGKVNDASKDLYAFENVVAKNDSGTQLESEMLMWRNKDQKIVTDKFVTITTPTEKIQGYGFESDQHLQNYIIHKPVYVTTSDSLR
ncbi:MAG: LPS export ABC transporter periplasmic protein LptC [Ignavibacteria bacterium CG_4_8_14_3_um_filter_37_9]|nr:LPS export ABC transporter periplasmic protein LptC [Ignavibacteria bacterium]NCS80243.1 LPS export ABC transporter periplasmic protein LptC [Ignavibacteria bacterium]PIW98056.1 MAG: LPS export ABC transporter periplasmic protein LptC [Ignavibacteria bacterium CG_4_8_14_3_um_filter_37_9]PIX93337.1 MAG: LPS export ABC transporter periplasmic protein LptC [Ignavibacteria bacterium CG_4_10_14_3_um_filter_37_18]PJC58586.1 MAG: LPS export ABC transporter periplasmic protein LptC [Ignavibacteria b